MTQDNYILPGDHIYYECGSYTHHGIYCGEVSHKNRLYQDVVIHFEGKFKSGKIRGISYEKFSQGRDIFIVKYQEGYYFHRDIVVRRAINKLGEPDYNLFGNNCEHFAHWCKTGKKISSQVNDAITAAGGIFGGAIGGGIAAALLPLAAPEVAIIGVAVAAGYAVGKVGETLAKKCTDSPGYNI